MELQDLNEEERVALAALVVQVIGADRGKSPEEMQEFREIGDEMGKAAFDQAFKEALRRGANERSVALELATAVERPKVRELIHTVLVDLAAADFVSEDERELIRTVAASWGINTRV